jgi:peptidylprolyl isomerase
VGSEKRERQKLSRQAKIEAEEIAARRARTKRTGIRVAVAAIVVIGAMFAYSAISGGDDDDSAADDAATTTTAVPEASTTTFSDPELAEEVMGREAPDPEPPPADTPKDALEETTVIEGEGDAAAVGDTVVVHYIGKTSDGAVFDSSWDRGEPYPVTLGPTAGVIDGWNEGLVGVKIGERRRLVIGSDMAYGSTGKDPIPPDAPLAFEIDVVDIQKAEPAEPADPTDSTDPAG